MLAYENHAAEDEGGVGFAGLEDVIGLGDDLGEMGIQPLKIAGVAFFDVGDLALGDNDLIGDDVCGDLAIDGAVDAPDGVNLCHACSLFSAKTFWFYYTRSSAGCRRLFRCAVA